MKFFFSDIEQEPCDGETPLTDGESGEDIRCTAENKGDECPSGSYCHIHSMGNFAVCCPGWFQSNILSTKPITYHHLFSLGIGAFFYLVEIIIVKGCMF